MNFIYVRKSIWVRLASIINYFFITFGILIINQNEKFIMGLLVDLAKKNVGVIIGIIIFLNLFVCVVTSIFNIEKYNLLVSCHQKNKLQAQTQNILDSIDQAVITVSEDGLQFSNTKGFDLLQKSAALTEKQAESS